MGHQEKAKQEPARGDVARVVAVVVNFGLFVGERGWRAGVPGKEHVVTRAADGGLRAARECKSCCSPGTSRRCVGRLDSARWAPSGRWDSIHLPEPFAATVLLQTRPPYSPWTDTLVRPGAVISRH